MYYYYYYLNIQSYYIFFILQQLYRLILGMGKFNFNNLLLTLAGAHASVAKNKRLEFERKQQEQPLIEMQPIQGKSNSGDVFGGKSRRRHCRCRSGTCRSKSRRSKSRRSKSRHCRRRSGTCRSRRTYRRH
jgi:hypothetical protein